MAETGKARFGSASSISTKCDSRLASYRILVVSRSLSRYLSAHVASLAMSWRVGVRREQHRDLRTCCRIEVVLGDE
jgi:hypothetical protein